MELSFIKKSPLYAMTCETLGREEAGRGGVDEISLLLFHSFSHFIINRIASFQGVVCKHKYVQLYISSSEGKKSSLGLMHLSSRGCQSLHFKCLLSRFKNGNELIAKDNILEDMIARFLGIYTGTSFLNMYIYVDVVASIDRVNGRARFFFFSSLRQKDLPSFCAQLQANPQGDDQNLFFCGTGKKNSAKLDVRTFNIFNVRGWPSHRP